MSKALSIYSTFMRSFTTANTILAGQRKMMLVNGWQSMLKEEVPNY